MTGLVISALVPSVEIALALGPPAIIIALLFGGFYSKSFIQFLFSVKSATLFKSQNKTHDTTLSHV
jgi:hypothetical protein